MNFNNILIGSEDPQRLVDYYNKLFGEGRGDSTYTGWQLGNGYVSVGPHSEVKGKSTQPGRLIWNIETDDVKGTFAKFRAAGAIVVREPYKMDGGPEFGDAEFWIATLADPDGNYFQLTSPFPEMGTSGS